MFIFFCTAVSLFLLEFHFRFLFILQWNPPELFHKDCCLEVHLFGIALILCVMGTDSHLSDLSLSDCMDRE